MKNKPIVVGISILLTACGVGDEELAKQAMIETLKDPDSAIFGQFTMLAANKLDIACLTVNSRNSSGGYTGKQEVIMSRKEGEEWEIRSAHKVSHDICVAKMAKHLEEGGLLQINN